LLRIVLSILECLSTKVLLRRELYRGIILAERINLLVTNVTRNCAICGSLDLADSTIGFRPWWRMRVAESEYRGCLQRRVDFTSLSRLAAGQHKHHNCMDATRASDSYGMTLVGVTSQKMSRSKRNFIVDTTTTSEQRAGDKRRARKVRVCTYGHQLPAWRSVITGVWSSIDATLYLLESTRREEKTRNTS
jgi:hypothetical protein